MTRINKLVTSGQKAGVKAAAALAAYKATKGFANQAADLACHVWTADGDDWNTFRGAKHVMKESALKIPGARQKASSEDGPIGWVTLRLPGTGFVQAKRVSHDIMFRAVRMADLDAVRTLVEEETARLAKEDQEFDFIDDDYVPELNLRRWKPATEEWAYTKPRKGRSFSSVIMSDELREDIESDLKKFTESRSRLTKLELPWRRGYLLSGPPGTGKTSLSAALATSLGFSLASLSLTEIKSDGDLRTAVGNLPARTVLLIEDIDAYSVSHDRDHNSARDGGLSLSGLLNALDGAETQDGLITVLTTNHIEKLDPALVRSGRIDRNFHLGYIEAEGVAHMFKWFYEVEETPATVPDAVGLAGVSPADVVEVLKHHLDDPQAGWDALMQKFADSLRVLEGWRDEHPPRAGGVAA